MTEQTIAMIIVGVFGTLLTFARRYKNPKDPAAGVGCAGWTLFALIVMAPGF